MAIRRNTCSRGALFPSVVSLGLICLACGESADHIDADLVSVQVVGDTTTATSERPEVLDTARLVQVARIGQFDGPEEFLLSGVESFTVGWRGEVYVADEGIRVFSPDGSEVRRIARTGEGPGEVGVVIGMAVDDLGRLLASDLRNRRIAVYDTSGTVLDHWRLPNGRPIYGRPAVVPFPGNQTLIGVNPPLDPSSGPQGGFPRPIYVRFDSAGTVLDTVFAPTRFGEKCTTLDDPRFASGFWQDIRESLYPKLKWTASRFGEVVLGCPAEYVVDRVRANGAVLRLSHLREPVVEPQEVRDFFVSSLEQSPNWASRGLNWQGPRPPEEKPHYHRLNVGRGGRLWIWPGHPREELEFAGPPVVKYWQDPRIGAFDVFEPDGHFLGPVLLPEGVDYRWHPGYGEPFFAGDTVWLVRYDSLDVSYVDRMSIEW